VTTSGSASELNASRILFYQLTFVDEGDQVIVGRPDIDSFAVFPVDAAAVLRKLVDGADLTAAAAWYQATYGEPVDMEDFAETLRDLDFVRPEEPLSPAGLAYETAAAPPEPVRSVLGNVLLSRPALALYALAVAASVYLMIRTPALRPTPSAVYFSKSLLVVLIAVSAGQLAGIAVHEWFHVLAGRRLGLPSKLSVGRRLYFVVFQTTLLGLMGVPSRKRILPFMAGLIADSVLISALTGLAEAARVAGWPAEVTRVAVAMAYITVLRMIWQALIFMETDLYHVLCSAVRCPDLHQMTVAYLRNQFARLRGKTPPAADEQAGWTARELRVVRGYTPVVLAGSVVLIAMGALAVIPVIADLVVRVYQGVETGGLLTGKFWDSLLGGLLVLSPFATAAAIAVRDRARSRSAAGSRPA
jgi:hypothetical protein